MAQALGATYSPWLPGERGTPLAPGGLGRPHRQPPRQLRGAARFNGKERTGPARLPACNRHVLWRATGTSWRARPPAGSAPRMSCETPISVSSESVFSIAVTITSNSESAQTISFTGNLMLILFLKSSPFLKKMNSGPTPSSTWIPTPVTSKSSRLR